MTQIPRHTDVRLDEQRHVVHHDGVWIRGLCRGDPLLRDSANFWVYDRVQGFECLGIIEHDAAERRTVECSVCGDHRRAEPRRNRGKPGAARGDCFAGELIGVDVHRAVLGEPASNG